LEAAAKAKGIPLSGQASRFLQTETGFDLRDMLAGKTGLDMLLSPSERQIPMTTREMLLGRSDEGRSAPVSWYRKYLADDLE